MGLLLHRFGPGSDRDKVLDKFDWGERAHEQACITSKHAEHTRMCFRNKASAASKSRPLRIFLACAARSDRDRVVPNNALFASKAVAPKFGWGMLLLGAVLAALKLMFVALSMVIMEAENLVQARNRYSRNSGRPNGCVAAGN